jgi:predicted nucleic acid-binding protein
VILADTSVWVDYFRGNGTPHTEALNAALDSEVLVMGDLVLAELLQGFPSEQQARLARSTLSNLQVMTLGGREVALRAADHYRFLRSQGTTVRGIVDMIIATWCIMNDVPLIHSDRDFLGMSKWLGLQRWSG